MLTLAYLFANTDCSSALIFTQGQHANIAPLHLLYADMSSWLTVRLDLVVAAAAVLVRKAKRSSKS